MVAHLSLSLSEQRERGWHLVSNRIEPTFGGGSGGGGRGRGRREERGCLES